MNYLAELDFYLSGIEMGLLSTDDLREFVFETIEAAENTSDLPYVFYDLAVCPDKSMSTLVNEEFFRAGYAPQSSEGTVFKRLTMIIKERYFGGGYSLEAAVGYMENVALKYCPYSDMRYFADRLYLASNGIYGNEEQVKTEAGEWLGKFA